MKKNIKELGKRGKEAQREIQEFFYKTHTITKIALIVHQKITKKFRQVVP